MARIICRDGVRLVTDNMRELYIVRHAQAEPDQAGQRDFDRVLTEKGEADASRLGVYLAQQNLQPEIILYSPAKRTAQTFALIKSEIGANIFSQTQDRIYNASFDDLVSLISETDPLIQRIMLIGHNPGVHSLAMNYAKTPDHIVSFPPASLCVLAFHADWDNLPRRSGELKNFHNPGVF